MTNRSKYFFRRYPRITVIVFICTFLICIPCFTELLLHYCLHHPETIKDRPYLHRAVSHLYYMHELDIVQFQPQCARYDSVLFYALRPGECRHHSVEFDCIYSINEKGLRDDDASLNQSEIIVLGDSYTMGWGMENEKIFSSLLEKATGLKTLNVAVPSYGTAREFLMLRKLDLSNLKYLVIQYCTNDFEENKQYVDDGFQLKIESREFYETMAKNHVNRSKYKPFLYLSTLAKAVWKRITGAGDSKNSEVRTAKAAIQLLASGQNSQHVIPNTITSVDSARYFLEILKSMPSLEGVQIIVTNISGPFYTTSSFINALAEIKSQDLYPSFIQNMKLMDVCRTVNREDYFILDCHLNEQGHRRVVDLLLKEIRPHKTASAGRDSE